jgi:ABC-2 type transport system ATP-binding protein
MLKRLKEQGITIIVSTPYMDEATLCDKIALIQNGKILSIDAPESVVAKYPDDLYELKADNMYKLLKSLEAYDQRRNSYAFGEFAHATFKTGLGENTKKYLQESGLKNVVIRKATPTIEDCFIKLLGH